MYSHISLVTAFYAFLRVGEMTSTSTLGSPTPPQISQLVKLVDAFGNTVALKLNFADFKHNYNQHPFSIVIYRQPPFCPVQLGLDYLALRGSLPGPLFSNLDNSPVSRTFIADMLCLALKSCGLSLMRYKGHSFRIGAAFFCCG